MLTSQQYMLCNKDPRRVQPLVDYLVEKGKAVDYNGESSFDGRLGYELPYRC